jgi:hypothetical protein
LKIDLTLQLKFGNICRLASRSILIDNGKNNKKASIENDDSFAGVSNLFSSCNYNSTYSLYHSMGWGLKTLEEMYAFEGVLVSVNIFITTLLFLKEHYVKHRISDKVLNWLETLLEKLVFTPLTFQSTILIWIILRKEGIGITNAQRKP